MRTFSRILVDIDAGAAEHPGLDDAVALAAALGAAVKIVDVLPEIPPRARRVLEPRFVDDIVSFEQERLASVAERVRAVPVTTELLRGRPATALIDEIHRSGHDLLVRSHGRDRGAHGRPFGAIDMELLRECPCPVWLAARRTHAEGPTAVLAAVHASVDEPIEQELNRSILDLALMVRDVQRGRLAVVQAWSAFGETLLKSHLSPEDLLQYVDAARTDAEQALSELTVPFEPQLAGATVELLKGEPEEVIAEYVTAHSIDLVVMGTVARSGMVGAVMGNTAERVLQRVRASVLAVKPRGLASSLRH